MKKIKRAVIKYIKCDGIIATLALAIMLYIYIRKNILGDSTVEIIDWTLFSSIVVTLALSIFANMAKILLMNHLEDSDKLTEDYAALTSKYVDEMIVYDNSSAAPENIKKIKRRSDKLEITIPVICSYKLKGCTISIQDSKKRYQLPEIIQNHYNEVLAAHSTSSVYNQLNIRVDDWMCDKDKFVISTSRTSYFDSLVTNRAMDFRWSNGVSVRELFEFGPFLHSLNDSSLSNHLGFNGFVESSDGYIVFVKRGNQLSIGKRTYANSVGASLKTKYALDDSGNFTLDGLRRGILQEIEDELKIPESKLEEFSNDKHIIGAYRDIVEGGKPQLLFYIQSVWTKDFIEQNFRKIRKKNRTRAEQLVEDGKIFLWIPKSEMNKICILPDMIIYRGKRYKMMPSAIASIVMLIEHLK